jgi:hypothetical protein
MLFKKPFKKITFNDVQAFCDASAEGVRVEYKQKVDTDKIPKVVSSFANTVWGVLIIESRPTRPPTAPFLQLKVFSLTLDLRSASLSRAMPSSIHRRDFESIYCQYWQLWADRLPATITRKEIRLWHLSLEQTPGRANKGV